MELIQKQWFDEAEKDMKRKRREVGQAKKRIAEKGKDTKYGARPLRRAMQTELEDKLAEAILNGEVKPGEQIEAGVSGKEIKFYLKNAN